MTPYNGPTNNPNPSSGGTTLAPAGSGRNKPPAPQKHTPSTAPAPSTPSPTVAKGGTDRFGLTHFYPDSPTGVKWYIMSC